MCRPLRPGAGKAQGGSSFVRLNTSNEFYGDSKAADYRGTVNTTKSGLTCLSWKLQNKSAGGNGYWTGSSSAAANGIGNHNYCRNPDGHSTAWCYTASRKKRWEACDVGKPKTPGTLMSPALLLRTTHSWTMAFWYRLHGNDESVSALEVDARYPDTTGAHRPAISHRRSVAARYNF